MAKEKDKSVDVVSGVILEYIGSGVYYGFEINSVAVEARKGDKINFSTAKAEQLIADFSSDWKKV
jgi:hypothetical protein